MEKFILFNEDKKRIMYEESFVRIGLPPASIEKDFWVCFILNELFKLPDWQENLTFKGGTSLSKGWKLISRFSEDIDVVINRSYLGFGDDNLNRSKRDKLRDVCRSKVQNIIYPCLKEQLSLSLPKNLQWQLIPADINEDKEQLSILFYYQSVYNEKNAYLRPIVKIEFGGRADTDPVELPCIKTFLSDAFPELFINSGFSIRTVAPKRTFWEKVMLLHEEKYRPVDKKRKSRLSRHYYDVWCLIEKGISSLAMDDILLFKNICNHRKLFYNQKWVDYEMLSNGNLDLIPTDYNLREWEDDYNIMRDVMFFDNPPSFNEIILKVQNFQNDFICIFHR